MAKARLAAHPKAAPEPANDNQPSKVNKADIVRQALAQGLDDLDDIADFIKKQHGIDIPRAQLSSYKAQQRARDRKAAGEEPRHRSTGMQHAMVPPNFGDDIRAVKEMIEKAGGSEEFSEQAQTIGRLAEKYGVKGLQDLIAAFG